MGKSVTVISGFTDVELPAVVTVSAATAVPAGTVQIVGIKPYSSGQTAVLTDAEYAALPASITRALGTASTVAEPARPSTDTRYTPVTTNATVTGTFTAAFGINRITLTGNVTTYRFPNSPVGTSSIVDLRITQDATGSRTITWTGSGAKFAGGTAPTLSTVAAKIDRLIFRSAGDGASWDLVTSLIALA